MRSQVLAIGLLTASVALADDHEKFEVPGNVAANDFVPEALQTGPNHTVSSEATSDGFQNTYTVNSKYGAFQATGIASLRKQVTEVDALANLEAVSRADVFANALRDAGVETAGAIAKVFTSPVTTVQGIPDGIGRVFEGAKRGFGLTRRMFQGKSNEDGIEPADFREMNYLLGNSERKWAQDLKTDPYTTNMKLRETISSMSVVEFMGGLPVDIVLPMGGGLAVSVLGDETEIYKQSAEQLEATNRVCLETLGIDSKVIDEYVAADYLTPTSQTAICNAMSKLQGVDGRNELVSAIAASQSFEGSNFLIQVSNMMAWYQSELDQAKITAIVVSDGLPSAQMGDETALMLPAENLQWTEVFANRIAAMDKGSVWILGSPSAETAEHLSAKGWQVNSTDNNESLASLHGG